MNKYGEQDCPTCGCEAHELHASPARRYWHCNVCGTLLCLKDGKLSVSVPGLAAGVRANVKKAVKQTGAAS